VINMDSQLRNLLDIAAGEPPHQVTVGGVRRTLVRRRITASVAAALAVVLVGGAGVAVSSVVTGAAPTSATSSKNPPPYYLQTGGRTLIRSTATGAITGRVHCPGHGSRLDSAAVAGPSTFFVSCGKLVRTGPRSQTYISEIYRFTLTSKGRITGYDQVRGGTLTGSEVYQMAASPDGSELALAAGGIGGPAYKIVVINAGTGSHTTWTQTAGKPSQVSFVVRDLSFTGSSPSQGTRLVFLVSVSCDSHLSGCKSPVSEVRELSPAGPGTLLPKTTLLFKLAALAAPKTSVMQAVQVSPDGSVVTVVLVTYNQPGKSKPLGVLSVVQASARSGKVLRVLYQAQAARSYASFQFFSADSSGRYLLLGYDFGSTLASGPLTSGWLDQGKLVPLPHSGTDIGSELW
jgi:hypothetical protein